MSTSNSTIKPDASPATLEQHNNASSIQSDQSSNQPNNQSGNMVTRSAEHEALLAELERDGFTMLGLTGKPAALETMQIRISRAKISLGRSAWEAMGSPNAVLGLQRGQEKVLALIASSSDEPNALAVVWDAKLAQAFIRGATWIGALLGAGSKVAMIDVVFERGRLIVDASRVNRGARQGASVRPKVNAGAGAKQSARARAAVRPAAGKS